MNGRAMLANCEARKQRVTLIAAAVGSLATLAGFLMQALGENEYASHFTAGFGAGLTLVATVALVRMTKKNRS